NGSSLEPHTDGCRRAQAMSDGIGGGIGGARLGALAIGAALVACSSGGAGGDRSGERAQAQAAPIVGGSAASAYPEAALIDMYQSGQLYAACSGSVIAPKVVLTAGHCVDGTDSWKVRAPFANGQHANATTGATYDW